MPEIALKKGWARVAFGDVVKLSGERSSNPKKDGFERFVGLEHIDPGDLKIRRWGDIADGTTFISVFRPGQVLFGKRRAYQRKVAVADFSGVCSGDIYVFEPKNDHLLPALLPFICQTDGFFEHAVGTSAGSLSPRTSWDSLASYEFALPQLEEQGRIAEVLRRAELLFQAHTIASASYHRVHLAFTEAMLSSCQAYPEARLGDLCARVGVGIASSAAHAYRRSGVPMIRNNNIEPGRLALDDLLYLDPAFDKANRSKRVRAGDVVTARTGIPGASAVVPPSLDGAQTFTTLVSTPLPGRLDSDYLCLWINSPRGREFIASRKGGGVQKNMNAGLLRDLPISLPPIARQQECVSRLQEFSMPRERLLAREAMTKSLLRSLREALVG